MISLYSFLNADWMSLSETDPVSFIQEVENRCIIKGDFRRYISLVKNGSKVTKETASKRVGREIGQWSVKPYFRKGLETIRRNVENGRIPLKEATR